MAVCLCPLQAPLIKLLERNKLSAKDVDAVELLGGGSRVPKLQAELSEALGGRWVASSSREPLLKAATIKIRSMVRHAVLARSMCLGASHSGGMLQGATRLPGSRHPPCHCYPCHSCCNRHLTGHFLLLFLTPSHHVHVFGFSCLHAVDFMVCPVPFSCCAPCCARHLDRHLDADEAVVLGAGLFAANLSSSFRLRVSGTCQALTVGPKHGTQHLRMLLEQSPT